VLPVPHTGNHYIQGDSMIKTPVTLRWARAKQILATHNLVAGDIVFVPSSTQGNYKVQVHFDAKGYLDGATCTCKDFLGWAAILHDAKHEAAPRISVPAWAQQRAYTKHNVVAAVQNHEESGVPLHYSGGHVVLVCKHILAAATTVTAAHMRWPVSELLALEGTA